MLLLGIDATNWIHQLYYSNRGMNVLVTAVARARALVEHVKPAAVVACFDCGSFRYELLDTYKDGRKQKDTALVDYLHAAPKAFGKVATIVEAAGFEADDGLATLAAIGRHQRDQVVIASPDKDLRQSLAEGSVTLLRHFSTARGNVSHLEWYTWLGLQNEFGLRPEQWTDYQALVGDSTDSIVGADGWGPKTASAAMVKCGSIEKMLANPWAVPCSQRQRNSLLAFRARLDLIKQLVTLRTDVSAVYDALR